MRSVAKTPLNQKVRAENHCKLVRRDQIGEGISVFSSMVEETSNKKIDSSNNQEKLSKTLTHVEALRTLCSKGTTMKKSRGKIRAKGKCPICGRKFTELKGIGYLCPEHKTVPQRLYVDLSWKGKRIRIFSDKTGHALDSYDRAEEVLNVLNYEIRNHVFDSNNYIKAEASKFWANNLLERFEVDRIGQIAPSYKKDYRRMIRIAKEFYRNQDVREIRKLDIINYMKYCQERFKWSSKTLKNNIYLFHAFLNYLKDDLEIISIIPPFPRIIADEPNFRWVGANDQIKLFEKVPDEDKPIIGFLMLHGCRPGEARALKCKDVNLENESITISATFSGNVYREKRKGRQARKIEIPIHPEAIGYLRDRLSESVPEAFVFENPRNLQPYSQNSLRRVWEKARIAANVSNELRLYDASRHSYASQLVNKGVSLYKVSRLLGHSTIKTSEKYSHTNLDSLRIELISITLNKKTVTDLSSAKKLIDRKI